MTSSCPGSEISGGVEDVLFTNMVLLNSPGGGVAMVKLKNECGRGGFVRNVHWHVNVCNLRRNTLPTENSLEGTGESTGGVLRRGSLLLLLLSLARMHTRAHTHTTFSRLCSLLTCAPLLMAACHRIQRENMTAGTVGNGVSAGRYGTPASVSSCNDTGTIKFSNLTAKNIYVASAVDGAYEIAGYKTPSAQQQFLNFVLENFTVQAFSALGSCSNADVHAVGAVSPKLPPCTNSTRPPPPPSPAPSRKCAATATLGCYNDAGAQLLPKLQPQLHDHVTIENCASACFGAGSKVAGIDGGNHCSCGDAVADAAARARPAAECAGPCHGNPDEKRCGAADRMVAYTFQCD